MTETVQETRQVPTPRHSTGAPLIQPAPRPMPEWKGQKLEAFFTREMGDKRVLIKRKKISARKRLFRWNKGFYYIDPDKIFILGKRSILLYDIDYAEPLSEDNPRLVTKPENPKLIPHHSFKLETLIHDKALLQALSASKDKQKAGSPWMMIMLLLLGVVLGYFIGAAMPPPHATTGTVTSTTGVHTISGLIHLLWI